MAAVALSSLVVAFPANGQLYGRGARSGGMPAQAAYDDGPSVGNPAALRAGEQIGDTSSAASILSLWMVQLYGLPELRIAGAEGRFHALGLDLGAQLSAFGFDRYVEHRVAVVGAMPLAGTGPRTARLGIAVRASRISDSRSIRRIAYWWKIGLVSRLSTSVSLGGAIENSLGGNVGGSGSGRGSMVVGGRFQATPHIDIHSDLFLERSFPVSCRAGVEAALTDALQVRGGFSTAPERLTMGLSLSVASIQVHFAFERHALLGWSSAVELGIRL